MASRNAKAIGQMAEWGKRFEEMASPQQKGALTRDMSKATLALIEEGFRREMTPYGQKWRPKQKPNGKQILVDSGSMRGGFRARVGLGRFSIRNSEPYTGVHQNGSRKKNIPKRQMWPTPSRLPVKYIRAYTSIFQKRSFAILMGRKP